MSRWARLGIVVAGCASVLAPPSIGEALLIREVRAVQAELKGFGYVEIAKQKWCIVSAEAELMEATSGRPIGEAYFGTREPALCQVLWDATKKNFKVDISGIPEKHIIDPLFLGSVKKIYIIGFAWVRTRASAAGGGGQ